MMKNLKKIAKAMRLIFSNPIYVNAYVKAIDGKVFPVNWGDDINYHFIKFLTKREVVIYFNSPTAMTFKLKNYLCIGSTLNYLPTRQSIVWGSGVIDELLELREIPSRIHAVRGPLTRQFLLARDISCPEVYGDPALLIPYFYRPDSNLASKKSGVCLIPHYTEMASPVVKKIKDESPEIDVLDIANYGNWTDFIDRVCKYEKVLSSSLHGLIVAESFGIPNQWVMISDGVIGNGFKFRDYYQSIGKNISTPIRLDLNSSMSKILDSFSWQQGKIDTKKLLDSCPFFIKEPVRYEHPMAV